MFVPGRCFFPMLVALATTVGILITQKYDVRLPNPLKLWLAPSIQSDNHFGVFILADGIDPVVDVVAIHGLDGHFNHSWMAANGKLWLRDFLPDRIPHARIISYGYDAYTHSRSQLSYLTIHDHAETLVAALASIREETNTERRPIIFVAHSLGGIILKYAMVYARLAEKNNRFNHKSVELSTYGINFLGTPHQGTNAADLRSLLLDIRSIYSDTNDAILRDLALHSSALQQQLSQYSSISREYKTKFFYETLDTLQFGGIKKRVVHKYSAVVPGAIDAEAIPLHKDHVGMAKFESDSDGDFRTIASHITNMVKAAPSKIAKRWEVQDRREEVDRKVEEGIEIMTAADREMLDKLPYAKGASISKSGCLPGTRTAIIDDILTWARSVNQTQAAEIYLLTGGAGVGKTSIAQTITQRCKTERFLTASFFFDGRDAERNKPATLFSTMARDLAEKNGTLRRLIVDKLEETISLAHEAIQVHFTELILTTSRSLRREEPVVIIIDALDESLAEGINEVLQVLRDHVPQLPGNFRILITTRMTENIAFYLLDKPHVRIMSLGTTDPSSLRDIAFYSRHTLRDVAQLKGLGEDWPGGQPLEDFISRAGGLFIWVSTVHEFLRSCVDPDKQLRSLVSTQSLPGSSPEQKIDELYRQILGKCNWDDDDFVRGYHLIMGSIMAAKIPLSLSALRSLHRHTQIPPLRNLLAPLTSLFTGVASENTPVQILHQSLKDFITNRARSSPEGHNFYLNETQHSQRLALLCLVVLNEDLPHVASAVGYLAKTESVVGIPQIAGDIVSGQILYACQFWMDHVASVEQPTQELVDTLQTFLHTNLDTWMELVTVAARFEGLSKVGIWIQRELSNDFSGRKKRKMATSLSRLYDILGNMDRREEALRAIEDAVELYHGMKPGFMRPSLAPKQNSFKFLELGPSKSKQKLVSVGRQVNDFIIEVIIPVDNGELPLSLSSLAQTHSILGRREQALEAAEEAVELFRPFARVNPQEFDGREKLYVVRDTYSWLH